jgi:hypothetical protein
MIVITPLNWSGHFYIFYTFVIPFRNFNVTCVVYIPEDGHMVGRNKWKFIVCTQMVLVHSFAFVGTIIVYSR